MIYLLSFCNTVSAESSYNKVAPVNGTQSSNKYLASNFIIILNEFVASVIVLEVAPSIEFIVKVVPGGWRGLLLLLGGLRLLGSRSIVDVYGNIRRRFAATSAGIHGGPAVQTVLQTPPVIALVKLKRNKTSLPIFSYFLKYFFKYRNLVML